MATATQLRHPWDASLPPGPVRRKRIWDPNRGLNWSGRPSRAGPTTGSQRQPDSPGVPGCFRARTMRRSSSLVSMTKSVKSTKSNKSTRSTRSGRSARSARSARSTRSTRAARAARARQVALRNAARNKPLPPLPGLLLSSSYAHAPLPLSHAPSVPDASAAVPTSNSAPVRLYVRTDGVVGTSPHGGGVVLVADLCPRGPQPYISFEIPTTPAPVHQPDHTHSRSTHVPSTNGSTDPAHPIQAEISRIQTPPKTNQSPSLEQVLEFTHLSKYPVRSSSRNSNQSDHSDASDISLATEHSEGHVMQATRLNRAQIAAGQLPSAHGSSTSLAEVKRPTTSQATQPLHGQATDFLSSPSLDIAPAAFEPLWQERASSAPEANSARGSIEILNGPSYPDSHHDTLANPDTVLGRMLSRAQTARSNSTPAFSGHGPTEVQRNPKRSLPTSPSTQNRTSVETSHVRFPSDLTASSTTHATAYANHHGRSPSIESLSPAMSSPPDKILDRFDPTSIVSPCASAPSELTHALDSAKLKRDAESEAKIPGQSTMSLLRSSSKRKQTASSVLGCLPKSGNRNDEPVEEDPWVQQPNSQVRVPSSRSTHKRSSNQSTHLRPTSERRKQKDSAAVKALLELLDRQTSAVDAMQGAYAEAHKVQTSELDTSEKNLRQARAQMGTLVEELASARSQLDAAAGLQAELEEAREDAVRARAETLRTKALLYEAQQEIERRAGQERELEVELLALQTRCTSPDPNSHGSGNHTFGGDDPESSGSIDRNSTHLSVSQGDWTPEQLAARRQRPTLVNQLVQLQEEHRQEIARLQARHAVELAQARELGRRTRSAWLLRTRTPSPSYPLDRSDRSGTQSDTEPKSDPLPTDLTGLVSSLGSAHGSDLRTPTAVPVRSASTSAAVSGRGSKGRLRSKRSYPLKLDAPLSTPGSQASELLFVPDSFDLSTEDLTPQLQVSAPSNHSLTGLDPATSQAEVSLSSYPLRLGPSSVPPQSQEWPTSSSPVLPSTPSSVKSEPLRSEF